VNQRLAHTVGKMRLYHLYNRKFGKFHHHTIDSFIHEYSRAHSRCSFIQVGGNDGITWDPFHYFIVRDKWQGIVLEPQREVFERRLSRTYRGVSGVQLVNAAVDVMDGVRPLYRYAFTSSRWASGAASLDRAMLIAGFKSEFVQRSMKEEGLVVRDNPDEYITSEPVQCVSFETILGRLQSDTLDFLLTDVEGYDVRIIESFPLDRIRPANVVFELPRRMDAAFANLLAKFRTYGYDVLMSAGDAIAMRRDARAELAP